MADNDRTYEQLDVARGALTGLLNCIGAGSPPDVLRRFANEALSALNGAEASLDALEQECRLCGGTQEVERGICIECGAAA